MPRQSSATGWVFCIGAVLCAGVGVACDWGGPPSEPGNGFDIVIDHVVRIGDREGPGILSGQWAVVHRLTEGRYVVADQGMGTRVIQFFDGDGRYLTDIGRRGVGPGEFQRPTPFVLHSTGDSLFVFDGALGRISVFSPDADTLYETRLTRAGRPNLALLFEDGSMLTNAVRTTADGAGLPLHLVDPDGHVTWSFGTDFPASVRMERPTHLRYMDVDGDGTLWVVPAYEERLERWRPSGEPREPWVLDTTFVLDTAEHFPPVSERHGWARTSRDPPPPPRFHGVWREDGGPVWVMLYVPHPEYRERLSDGVYTPEVYTADRTQEVTRVLAVDPESGRILASRDHTERWSRFVGGGEAYSYGLTQEGFPYLDLWRPRLVSSTRR